MIKNDVTWLLRFCVGFLFYIIIICIIQLGILIFAEFIGFVYFMGFVLLLIIECMLVGELFIRIFNYLNIDMDK